PGKIKPFNDRYSVEVFEDKVIVHDHDMDRDATIPVGPAGRPVKGAFQSNIKSNANLQDRLGSAVTDEGNLFAGDLVGQGFEGGVQLYCRTVNKTWFAWHPRRKAAAEAARRVDYVWIDDALPPGVTPALQHPHSAPWEFVGKAEGPVHSGEKAVKITAN